MTVDDKSRDFWRVLLPQLTLDANGDAPDDLGFSTESLDAISADLWRDGYIRLPAVFDAAQTEPLAQAMLTLTETKIPPVYIYLYDQPWQMFARLNRLISHFLGPQYAVLPNFWAWHLDRPGSSGWPPHRDCNVPTVIDAGGENILISLSLWISLTPANQSNGCMHVIPRNRQAEYDCDPSLLENINPADDIPLAVPAGSVLGWPQDLFHWGGAYTARAKNPRSSLSFEFQNRTFAPLAEPLLDVKSPPDFKTRLDLINGQFEKYRHIVPELTQKKM